jgi:hypothetical protein
VNKAEYMVDEIPADERWEDLIVSTRLIGDIEKVADNGCRRSRIELKQWNLNRGCCAG